MTNNELNDPQSRLRTGSSLNARRQDDGMTSLTGRDECVLLSNRPGGVDGCGLLAVGCVLSAVGGTLSTNKRVRSLSCQAGVREEVKSQKLSSKERAQPAAGRAGKRSRRGIRLTPDEEVVTFVVTNEIRRLV